MSHLKLEYKFKIQFTDFSVQIQIPSVQMLSSKVRVRADMCTPLIPEEMFMWIKCENRNEKPTILLFLSKKINTKSQLNEKKNFNLHTSFQFDTTGIVQ